MIVLAIALATTAQDDPDCARFVDQVTSNLCAAQAAGRADERLNAVWRRFLARVRADNAKPDGNGRDAAFYVQKYRAAQRAWVAYRDAQCAAERYATGGGTGDNEVEMRCVEQLTSERIAHYERLLK